MPAKKRSTQRTPAKESSPGSSKRRGSAPKKNRRRKPLSPASAARDYIKRGFCPVPLREKEKRPTKQKWPELRINADEVEEYFGARSNVGLLLGEASGDLVDVDIDCDTALLVADQILPPTGMVSGRSSRPESHRWYRSTNAATRVFKTEENTILEVRAAGAQTMVPPSRHPSGERVTWHRWGEPAEVDYDDLIRAASLLGAATVLARNWPRTGARHEASLALSGILLRRKAPVELAERLIWATASIAGDEEVDARVASVESTRAAIAEGRPVTAYKKAVELFGADTIKTAVDMLGLGGAAPDGADGSDKKKSQADRLVELAAEFELFRAPGEEESGYAFIDQDGRRETLLIESTKFRNFLKRCYWVRYRKAVSTRALQDAVGAINGQALYDGQETPVFVRLGSQDGTTYLDLGDEQQRVVRISAAGWSIETESPVRFLRPRGLLELPAPTRQGDLQQLREYVNVEEGDDWILLLVWLTAALRPGYPCPILALHGEQGSAKSVTSKVTRSVIDPNTGDLRPQPSEIRDLAIASKNGLIVCLDNVSFVDRDMADALCRLVTGGAFATRKLYTDADEVLFEAKKPIILNGIPDLATHSDLVDRMIPLTLPTIPEGERRTESELWEGFNDARPAILGALLDVVCSAMARLPDVKLEKLPRMADFAVWGAAAEEALGLRPGEFLRAYQRSRESAIALTLEGLSLVRGLIVFMRFRKRPFRGTATQLFRELSRSSIVTSAVKGRQDWPKAPNALAAQLRRCGPAMRQVGFQVRFEREASKARTRTIHITYAAPARKTARKKGASRKARRAGRESEAAPLRRPGRRLR